ncbi:MAG: hypothetical protein NT028_05265 [candidate division Zixibacteria bacterium]|nr:hypothetical protein [candidate division Zixibacteria bacterium]
MNEQLDFLKLIASRLDGAGMPYMITGSMAMAVYSQPRMTRDIDLVVDLNPADGDRLVGLFREDCYIDGEAVKDAINRASMFNVIHKEWTAKADFIIRKNEEYRKVEFARRRKVSVAQVDVWVVSVEDLILSKLVWRGQSRSELQLTDVRQLITSNPGLDWNYLRKWATELGVEGTLWEMKNNA